MGKLVEHLMPCAICGAVPKINDIYDIDPEKAEHCYKLFCSENGVHNSTGEWFANKYKACQDWNRRQQALGETIGTLGNRLKPCPFCGRMERTVELLEQRNKELEQENQKLKQMLKKVADDAKGLFMGFTGYNPYEKRLKHEDCEAREYCDYCDRDCDCDGQCKWRYEDDVEKLLKETKERERKR